MRVLFMITSSEIGGAQTWVKDQCRLFFEEYDIHILVNRPGYLTDGESNVYFVKGLEKFFGLPSLLSVYRIVREIEPDVVVASSANAGLVARLLGLFLRARIVYVSHGWSCVYSASKMRSIFMFAEKCLSYLSDLIICVSKNDLEIATTKLGIQADKLTLIRNAVFVRGYAQNSGCNTVVGRKMRVLFLGRLAHPKRPDLLISALGDNTDFEIDIVGDGPLLDSLPKRSNVRFLGAINGFRNFCDYDVFCLISDSEGLPMSALEAAAFGLPLILSDVGGCGELLDSNGLLVANDVDSIREAFYAVSKNYSPFRASAIERRDEFCLYNQKHRYKEAYEDIRWR